MSANSEAAAPPRNPFPFQHRTNTLDRDRIVVPAGWDSWGKIAVLREGFDAKSWGEAWERDVDMNATDTVGTSGAKALYSSLVPDQGTKVCFCIFWHGKLFQLRRRPSHIAPCASTLQQPHPRTNFPCQTLRRESEAD